MDPDDVKVVRGAFTGPEIARPSQSFLTKVSIESTPIDYFKAVLPTDLIAQIVENSRRYAAMKGFGVATYKDEFKGVSEEDVYRFIGLIIRNGLAPVPNLKLLWMDPTNNFVYGDVRARQVFPSFKYFQCVKAFLHVSDPLKPNKKNAMDKVQPLIDAVNGSGSMRIHGPYLSLDEMDCGFQGRHGATTRNKFKRAGEGFLVDAVCSPKAPGRPSSGGERRVRHETSHHSR